MEYADAAQLGNQLVLVAPVVQRPLAADQRAGRVELGADLGEHPRRQEVRVDVIQAGDAEPFDEFRDRRWRAFLNPRVSH